jgi:hypothetical protein
VYAQRNIQARSCNHCCSGKAISVTYCEFVFEGLSIQHAVRMCHIIICGMPSSTISSTLSHKLQDFRKAILNTFYNFRPILMKILKFSKIFEKYLNMKFHENPSNGIRVVLGGETERRDDANSLSHNFSNVPKKYKRL